MTDTKWMMLTVKHSDKVRHGYQPEKDIPMGQLIIPLSERSMVNEECPSTSKETMQWKSKTEERKKRLGMFGYKLSC